MRNRVEITPRLQPRHFGNFEKTDPSVRYHYYPHIHFVTMSRLESMSCPINVQVSTGFGVQGKIMCPGKISLRSGFVDFLGGLVIFVKLKLESIVSFN